MYDQKYQDLLEQLQLQDSDKSDYIFHKERLINIFLFPDSSNSTIINKTVIYQIKITQIPISMNRIMKDYLKRDLNFKCVASRDQETGIQEHTEEYQNKLMKSINKLETLTNQYELQTNQQKQNFLLYLYEGYQQYDQKQRILLDCLWSHQFHFARKRMPLRCRILNRKIQIAQRLHKKT